LGFVMWSLTRLTRRGGDDRNWWALKRMLAVKKSKQNSRHGTGSEAIELTLRQAGSQAAVWSSFRQPYQRTLTKKSMHVLVIVIAMVNEIAFSDNFGRSGEPRYHSQGKSLCICDDALLESLGRNHRQKVYKYPPCNGGESRCQFPNTPLTNSSFHVLPFPDITSLPPTFLCTTTLGTTE